MFSLFPARLFLFSPFTGCFRDNETSCVYFDVFPHIECKRGELRDPPTIHLDVNDEGEGRTPTHIAISGRGKCRDVQRDVEVTRDGVVVAKVRATQLRS